MTTKFNRNIQSLENIFKFIEEFVTLHQLDDSISFAINLAVDELFTNMVKYHPDNPNDISISLKKTADKVIVTLTDYEVEPYNIKNVRDYDTTQPLQNRKPGGIGILLVKKFIDDIDYTYQHGISKITLVKYLEKNNVRDKN